MVCTRAAAVFRRMVFPRSTRTLTMYALMEKTSAWVQSRSIRPRSSGSSSRGHLAMTYHKLIVLIALVLTATTYGQQAPVGYDDTPMQPNGKWRVHDGTRPHPAIVTAPPAGDASAPAPSDAIVLLGTADDLNAWQMNDGSA